jgi:hypothetical protein
MTSMPILGQPDEQREDEDGVDRRQDEGAQKKRLSAQAPLRTEKVSE